MAITILLRLNLNGQGVGLDKSLFKTCTKLDSTPMKAVYERGGVVAMTFPGGTHDLWFITENMRWGQLPASTGAKAPIAAVNREDIWRAAAKSLGLLAPEGTSRGIETFFDGIKFDPETPEKYLVSQKIKLG